MSGNTGKIKSTKSPRRITIEWFDVWDDVPFVSEPETVVAVVNRISPNASFWKPNIEDDGVAKITQTIPINRDWFKME